MAKQTENITEIKQDEKQVTKKPEKNGIKKQQII